MRPAQFTWTAADRDGVAAAQTTAGATALLLNGALAVPLQPWISARYGQFDAGVNRTVSIYSSGNLSAIAFTVVGFDANNAAVSEVVAAGPNNSTVYTTALFNRVTSVTPNAAVGTNVEVGSGTTGTTNWYAIDYFQSPSSTSLWIKITAGTISVTAQLTPDKFLQTTTAPATFAHANLTAITADAASELPYAAQGVRFIVNSSTDGSAVFSIIQAGGYAG